LREVLNELRNSPPCIYELAGNFEYKVTFGIGGPIGFIQHSPANGNIPYLVAVNLDVTDCTATELFLAGNTETEIPRRYCLPFETVTRLVLYFAETGARSPAVPWEEI
jgi:hypothetical protein